MTNPGVIPPPLCPAAMLRMLAGACVLAFAPPGLACPQNVPPAKSEQAEVVTTQETQPTFKLKSERNLVTVRVVVRDVMGNPLGGLRKEDFRLLDNGKEQVISHFAVETPTSKASIAIVSAPQPAGVEAPPDTAVLSSVPQRYLAVYFDDVHMAFEDVARTREAASCYLTAAFLPTDRVGVFTSSGQGNLEFTDDRAKVQAALLTLRPRPAVLHENDLCPDISPYQAFLVVNRHDSFAIQVATGEDLHCRYNDNPRFLSDAQQEAERAAIRALNFSEFETEASLRGLDQLVRRMGALPGQRNIVVVSPGFMIETQRVRVNEIVDHTLRSKVTVNTLDSQGLAAPIPSGDASQAGIVPLRVDLAGNKIQIRLTEFSYNSDVLAELANSTGGNFFHNSNDLNEGFRRVGELGGISYVLSFSPPNLKLDGKFHTLRVTLNSPKGLSVQARRGYFAPNKPQDATTQQREEIQEALFSQEEVNELPVDVHTQFFRMNDTQAKLSVLTHVDLRFVRFRKQAGRNLDNLTMVTALFDRDGKYITSQLKTVEMRLRDASLEKLAASGITVKSSFEVKPGNYLIREVVRDVEGAQLSGLNRTVEIPY